MRIKDLSNFPASWISRVPAAMPLCRSLTRLPEGRNADTRICFRHYSGVEGYQADMTDRFRRHGFLRAAVLAAPIGFVVSLGGCAEMNDSMTSAFADPAKYELYDCKQLEAERRNLANRAAELQGLMAKAETGFAGPVVAEMAYRNDYVAVRGQSHFAEEAWRKGNCRETPAPPPAAKPAAAGKKPMKPVARTRSDTSVY